MSIASNTRMAEVTLAGRSPWHWFHPKRDDGDGRDDDWGGGQKTVTIVTTVTEPHNRQFSTKDDGTIMSKNKIKEIQNGRI